MLDDRVCKAGGAHNYHETMQAVRKYDERLANFVESRIPHAQWHAMVHEAMFEKRPLYERLKAVIEAMQADAPAIVVEGESKHPANEAWDVAKELAATYRCDRGFIDKPVVHTVIVTLRGDQVITGLPSVILKASDGIARDMESVRKWTFGFDNRIFIMDLGPDAIRELAKHPAVASIEYSEEPEARILGIPNPPYNPLIEQTDWGVQRILTAVPWGLTPPLYGNNVKVCVIDTGIDYNHQAYWKDGVCVYKGGFNFVASSEDPRDDQDHGCLHPDGMIYTSEGVMRIADFWKRFAPDPNAEGEVTVDLSSENIRTVSLDPDDPSMSPAMILKMFQIPVDTEIVKIHTVSGMRLTLTPWHPTYIWDGKQVVEKRADEINEDDYLVAPGCNVAKLGKTRWLDGVEVDEFLAYAAGVFAGMNGAVREIEGGFEVKIRSVGVARKFAMCCAVHGGSELLDVPSGGYLCRVTGGTALSLLSQLKLAHQVLALIGGSTEEVIANYLAGIIDGTGHCSWRCARLTIGVVDRSLGSAIAYLFGLLGIDVVYKERANSCSVVVAGLYCFQQVINFSWDKIERRSVNRRLRDFARLNGDATATPSTPAKSPAGYRRKLFSKFNLDYVSSIEREHYTGYFYDLSVDGHHNYLAGVNRCTFIHNTWCAGVIAEQHNGNGYRGVAPDVDLYACKALDSKGSGSYANIAAAVDWARTNGCHIISLSLGGDASQAVLKTACDTAWYAGCLICASAGNSGPEDNTVGYPAAYQSVVAVAAIDANEQVASFSSRGPEVEIAAPGVAITAPWAGFTYSEYATPDGLYMCASGTSPACPHVSGAAALIKSWYPFMSNIDLRMWIRDHSRDL